MTNVEKARAIKVLAILLLCCIIAHTYLRYFYTGTVEDVVFFEQMVCMVSISAGLASLGLIDIMFVVFIVDEYPSGDKQVKKESIKYLTLYVLFLAAFVTLYKIVSYQLL